MKGFECIPDEDKRLAKAAIGALTHFVSIVPFVVDTMHPGSATSSATPCHAFAKQWHKLRDMDGRESVSGLTVVAPFATL